MKTNFSVSFYTPGQIIDTLNARYLIIGTDASRIITLRMRDDDIDFSAPCTFDLPIEEGITYVATMKSSDFDQVFKIYIATAMYMGGRPTSAFDITFDEDDRFVEYDKLFMNTEPKRRAAKKTEPEEPKKEPETPKIEEPEETSQVTWEEVETPEVPEKPKGKVQEPYMVPSDNIPKKTPHSNEPYINSKEDVASAIISDETRARINELIDRLKWTDSDEQYAVREEISRLRSHSVEPEHAVAAPAKSTKTKKEEPKKKALEITEDHTGDSVPIRIIDTVILGIGRTPDKKVTEECLRMGISSVQAKSDLEKLVKDKKINHTRDGYSMSFKSTLKMPDYREVVPVDHKKFGLTNTAKIWNKSKQGVSNYVGNGKYAIK